MTRGPLLPGPAPSRKPGMPQVRVTEGARIREIAILLRELGTAPVPVCLTRDALLAGVAYLLRAVPATCLAEADAPRAF